jgi:hypothetical protein
MRWACTVVALLPFLAGCQGAPEADACVSHYEPVADAPTRHELRRELREDVDPSVRALKVIDEHPDPGKVYVNLLDRRDRLVMSLDMWQRADGTWTAERWSQCID